MCLGNSRLTPLPDLSSFHLDITCHTTDFHNHSIPSHRVFPTLKTWFLWTMIKNKSFLPWAVSDMYSVSEIRKVINIRPLTTIYLLELFEITRTNNVYHCFICLLSIHLSMSVSPLNYLFQHRLIGIYSILLLKLQVIHYISLFYLKRERNNLPSPLLLTILTHLA